VNIECPLCQSQDNYLALDPVMGQPRAYVCLNVIGGNTRCEHVFTVTVIEQSLERRMTAAELEQLAESDRAAERRVKHWPGMSYAQVARVAADLAGRPA
jgi:hypothetical protein